MVIGKKNILICVFVLISITARTQSRYAKTFGDDYSQALSYMKQNRLLQLKIFEHNGVPADVLMPVIFPERIRYSIIRDYIETESLKIFYVNKGSEFADFSVGDFQIKPSFAEDIEAYTRSVPFLKEKYKLLIISDKSEEKTRKTRIKRLQNTAYQLFYISAFYDIADFRFNINQMSKEKQIRFTASAYNHGFTKSKESIEQFSELKFFPYGKNYPGKKYAYSDIAYDFYQHYFATVKYNE